MSERKKFKLPKKQPFFSFVKSILKLFYKKPKIINIGGKIEDAGIIVSNHSSMTGPVIYELYLPIVTAKWGAGEMLGNYAARFKYLRDVYFMQKRGYRKAAASVMAAFDAFFSKFFYKGMRVLPTWRDARLFYTVSDSIEILKDGTSVLIFPENSDEGYKEVLSEFNPGFVSLAENYFKRTKKDVPVYPVYYHDEKRLMIIGEPCFVQDYVKQGLTRGQIAEKFREKVNYLFYTYVLCANQSAVV